MRRRRLLGLVMLVGAVVLAAILASCGVRASQSAPPAPGPASHAASQAPAIQSCAFTALVATTNPLIVTGTGPTCDTLESGLAHDGMFWQPYTGTLDSSMTATCTLSGGYSSMTIYAGGSLAAADALQLCSDEESNGWVQS